MSEPFWTMQEHYAEDRDCEEATWGFQGIYDAPERAVHVILHGIGEKNVRLVRRNDDEWVVEGQSGSVFYIRRTAMNEGLWSCDWDDYSPAETRRMIEP